jgi:electron transfer flavoprotein beta subunit
MNIIVCIKQTFDTEAKIVLNSDGQIDANGVNLIINPNDEYAIEEGIRLKEKFGGEVTVVTLGSNRTQEVLRTALAMGADKAILISDAILRGADEWLTAKVLAQAVSKLPYDIVFVGRTAIDDGSSQVGVRLAEGLNLPSVTNVLKLEIEGNTAKVNRETDDGTERAEITLPALFTAQKGLNEPRYPKVVDIMKAKKKEIAEAVAKIVGLLHEEARIL